ncbi:uncharacterized protein K452DRAFT_319687 [Aplosporella prunicola CBS 121167]|uniref:Uncharacterized protein n=1 Tax=Aplosporella prunicola CBS 121167 TaxID=1176127 RepID=A0A6A6B893_9PEZI|nr:uncharacterized protein K452DRAFT_319687 [Aplosporella prunicola CBS 121167]KAF2140136.1 hypothetical protein K452DRAFT_319687 [Aplosporella prunicola CBS 121167]
MSLTQRTCRAALRHSARRAFSTTNVCQRQHLPAFNESSTPELGALLDQASKRIFAPAHLNKAQQDLVYKTKMRGRLEADPLTMSIGQQEITLEHINRHKEVPNRWGVLKGAMAQSKTREDWENVEKLVEAFHGADMTLKSAWQEKFVRSAFDAGFGDVVLLALRSVKKSGLSLKDLYVTQRVMWGIHENAQTGEWAEEPTAKALKYAEQVVDLMEASGHCGDDFCTVDDTRTQPFVVALPLEMAAVLALKHNNGKDVDGKVKLYAARLMHNMKHWGTPQESYELEDFHKPPPSKNESASETRSRKLGDANDKISRMLPMWHALTLARKVLQLEMPLIEDAERMSDRLEADIEARIRMVEANLLPTIDKEEYWSIKAWRSCVR